MGDAELVDEGGTSMTVGQRLREAREAAGLSLEDIATSTRIPTRHLESLENSDFTRLPAPTYTIGFAKNYAGAVGLDRAEIGDQLRAEMGGTRPAVSAPEVFEPADPARAMPKWLIFGTIAAIVIALLAINWLNKRALQGPDEVAAVNEIAAAPAPAQVAPQAGGPVVITATDAAWIEVKDGAVILKQGELAGGQRFDVPLNAAAPTLTTAKPEALRIAVGTTIVPMIGEPGTRVTVSLKPDDLLRPRATTPATAEPAPPQPPPAAAPRTAPRRPARSPDTPVSAPAQPPPPTPTPQPETNNSQPPTPTQ